MSADGFYRTFGKRVVDVSLAIAALILLGPALVITGLLVRMANGAPVLFVQIRPGLRGRPFVMVKFRTMSDSRDAQRNQLPDAQRLTRLGRMLRATSVDELPELLNVIMGDMSLVGPRPLLMRYLNRYTPEQARRHEVLPGMTGLAQVKGRNALTWEQKFALDVWYVDHVTFWLDVRILALTVWHLVLRDGISQPGHTTSQEFTGTPS